MSTQILGKFLLNGRIICVTGLHIGGSATGIEIGGLDNPVLKDPLTDEPFIPGSSLKGKLRSLTEWHLGLIEVHKKHKGYQAYACEELKEDRPDENAPNFEKWQNALIIARLYGPASDEGKVRATSGPSRLTVRDTFLVKESKKQLQRILGQGTLTEIKTENALDRVTSEATPRPVERVPAGSEFELGLILDAYEPDDYKLFKHLFASLSLLEHSSLGGGGSRGSGQIVFKDIQITWRSAQNYTNGDPGTPVELTSINSVEEFLNNFDKIVWPV